MHIQLFIARRERRLKQRELAKILNISSVAYSQKETGKSDFKLSEAITLANHFKMSLDELFMEQGQ